MLPEVRENSYRFLKSVCFTEVLELFKNFVVNHNVPKLTTKKDEKVGSLKKDQRACRVVQFQVNSRSTP